jgi:nitrite reductase/ring-hydroxylating ferredoxin subunit
MTVATRRLGATRDLPDGTARGYDARHEGEDPLFVVRLGQRFYAYRDRCPHQGARLPWRRDAYLNREATRIVCHAHGAEFDIASGVCLRGPCLGQSLESVSLEISRFDEILVIDSPPAAAQT